MSDLEQVNEIIDRARMAGFEIRFEMLSGQGGGFCQVANRKILFVDLSLNAPDQLEIFKQQSFFTDDNSSESATVRKTNRKPCRENGKAA
jgi:hypothetical protein